MNQIKKSKYILLAIFLTSIICCQEEMKVEKCSEYKNESYEEIKDSLLIKEAFDYHKTILEKFEERSIIALNHEAYLFQFYSSHGFGKSIKFEKKLDGYFVNAKCRLRKEWFEDCKDYQIKIDGDEWTEFEKMIYEFDFWTEEDFRGNKEVLDGIVFFLEGRRPEAEKCDKKSYKLIGRGSPRYDKIGALCESILEYEAQLAHRYFR